MRFRLFPRGDFLLSASRVDGSALGDSTAEISHGMERLLFFMPIQILAVETVFAGSTKFPLHRRD
jgi:hypothetical protein